jgi:flagellar hook-length control protein FliK
MMVFNPVYIQKTNSGELQLLGNGFSNQKPTYLFSDIIKVILAKTDQTEVPADLLLNADGKKSAVASDNPLLITDAEVDLYDKLMKLNFNMMDADGITNEVADNTIDVLNNLKMYLKGLTDKNETAPSEDHDFEIDKSDLMVVLSIFAGNVVNQTGPNAGNTDVASELKDFVKEVDNLIEGLESGKGKKLVVAQKDFTLEFHSLENGKIAVAVKPAGKENQSQQKIVSGDKIPVESKSELATLKITNSEQTQNNIPVDLSSKETNVNNDVDYKAGNNGADKNQNKAAIEFDIQKNDSTKEISKDTKPFAEQPSEIKNKNVDVKQEINFVNKNDETDIVSKAAVKNSDKQQNPIEQNKIVATPSEQQNNSKEKELENSTSQKPDAKLFFDGKVKVEVSTVKNEVEKNSTPVKNNSVQAEILTGVQPKNINGQDSDTLLKQASNVLKNDVEKTSTVDEKLSVKINLENTASEKETAGKINSLWNSEEINPKKETNTNDLSNKNELTKEEKAKTVKLETAVNSKMIEGSETVNKEAVNNSAQINAQNTAAVNKSNQNEKINVDNSDAEKTVSVKEKITKQVASSKESDQQRSDNQPQNSFEKNLINVNKTETFGKEIKQTVKVVEQSRLMNELENVIKSGEKKLVTINLSPEDLGSVKVSLDISDKSVSAKINVTNDSVRQMIMTQSENLKSSLSQSGIQLASLNVSVNNSDEKTTQHGKMKRKENFSDKKIVIKDMPGPVKVKNLGYNTYDYVV